MLGARPLLASPTGPEPGASADANPVSELMLAPPSSLPVLGPRYAPVTIDLYLPIGHRATASNLELARRLARESQDVRLLFHPVLGSDPAERGAEAIFAAWRQQPATARCFALAEALANHPEWLTATPESESVLLDAARGLGLDAGLLARDLRRHSQRPGLIAIWQRERAEVRSPPEVWVNGRRLRGPLSEGQLRDELERQRSRAYQQLRAGTPLTRLYEQLLVKERGEPSPPWASRFSPPPSSPAFAGLSARPPQLASTAVTVTAVSPRLELGGSPRRGPKVASVTIVLIGSLDSYSTYLTTRHVSEAWQRHRDSVQLVFQHAPTTDNGRRVALLLTQLGRTDPAAFWQAFDGILEIMQRRFLLRYSDIVDLLRRQRIDVSKLEAAIRDPVLGEAARALLNRDYQQAQRLGLPYLPVTLLNGRPVQTIQSAERIERLIDAELRRGVLARWLNMPR